MQNQQIIRILGYLLMIFSVAMVPPMIVALYYQDGGGGAFFTGFVLSLLSGASLFLPRRNIRTELRKRDGFLLVAGFWILLGLFGALPFCFSSTHPLSLADAVFESFSGLTTTGATVIVGLDELPHGVLFYRQQLQWLGGMGIIILAIAVLPMLGIGGMQLYRAEMPGQVKDSKLTPRIASTARALWFIYIGLTVACALAYWGSGMSLFDAIGHSFSTVALGGFSTHDANIGFFQSNSIELICVFFMILSGVNFSLHFAAVRGLSSAPYSKDAEFKFYLTVLAIVSFICLLGLLIYGNQGVYDSTVNALFQAVSIATTAGFVTEQYYSWPMFLGTLLIFASFIGGCAGSTGGGMKVIRFLLLFKQGSREIKKLIHPNAVFKIRVGGAVLPEKIIEAVWGFFAIYIVIFFILMLVLMGEGLDQITAFSALAACMNNLGPGLGKVAANYTAISDLAKWVLSIAMLFGRLEIFTLLVLISPEFWRN